MRLSLRGGEKVYINGAVLSVDRRVSIELLNDVTFLLETHILQAKDATTPLKQLYFVVQLMLMDPSSSEATRAVFKSMLIAEKAAFDDAAIITGLCVVAERIGEERPFDALRELRTLFAREEQILRGIPARSHAA